MGFYPFKPVASGGGISPPAGDIGGSTSVPVVTGIQGMSVAAEPAHGGYVPLAMNPAFGLTWGYPFQFDLFSYGAKGDGQIVGDGAMSSSASQHVLTCSTSAPFKAGDVGKNIVVAGAGGGTYTPLYTTISGFTDSAHVTLTAAATSTVSNGIVQWSSDDTAAIQSALNAAVAYTPGGGVITVDPFLFGVASNPVLGGGTLGNSPIMLPIISQNVEQVNVTWRGTGGNVAALPFGAQPVPQYDGGNLMLLNGNGTNDGTYGPAHVVGGPWDGYGAGGTFSNIRVTVDNVGILVPYNSTMGGWNFTGIDGAELPRWAVRAAAVFPAASSTVPIAQPGGGNITNEWGFGVMMPDVNNGSTCAVGVGLGFGLFAGFLACEHVTFENLTVLNGLVGMSAGSGSGSAVAHQTVKGKYFSCENCGTALGVYLSSSVKVDIDVLDYENVGTMIYDSNNAIYGQVGFTYNGSFGYAVPTVQGSSAGTPPRNMRIYAVDTPPGPITSPQAPPSSTHRWPNLYYKDAWIELSVSGGSLSALTIDNADSSVSVSQPGVSGATTYTFMLCTGQAYVPTYTGTLTHTVELM